jgi:hypothetical protein
MVWDTPAVVFKPEWALITIMAVVEHLQRKGLFSFPRSA